MPAILRQLARHLFVTVLPCTCLFCGHRQGPACNGCYRSLPWLEHCCQCCALPIGAQQALCAHCLKQPPPFTHALSLWAYEFPINNVIQRFKHQLHGASGVFLCQQLRRALATYNQQLDRPFDALLCVPSHPIKRFIRGYNPAYLLAQAVSQQLGIPLISPLYKSRWHRSQQGLNRQERLHNLQQSFAVKAPIDGLNLLLIDDVVTTTSTASVASQYLLDAGAKSITLASLARTPQHLST